MPNLLSVEEFNFYNTRARAFWALVFFHIFIITASNYLVQMPFTLWGIESTWGSLTFPFVFLATDLTVRIFGAALARKIIFAVMWPALLVSYCVSIVFQNGSYQGVLGLWTFNDFVGRIALASFLAYALGQCLDISVFNRLRQLKAWWIAPSAAIFVGNALDTAVFFGVAFYQSSDAFMAANWVNLGLVDYGIKLAFSLAVFIPLYGVLLAYLSRKLLQVGLDIKTNDLVNPVLN